MEQEGIRKRAIWKRTRQSEKHKEHAKHRGRKKGKKKKEVHGKQTKNSKK